MTPRPTGPHDACCAVGLGPPWPCSVRAALGTCSTLIGSSCSWGVLRPILLRAPVGLGASDAAPVLCSHVTRLSSHRLSSHLHNGWEMPDTPQESSPRPPNPPSGAPLLPSPLPPPEGARLPQEASVSPSLGSRRLDLSKVIVVCGPVCTVDGAEFVQTPAVGSPGSPSGLRHRHSLLPAPARFPDCSPLWTRGKSPVGLPFFNSHVHVSSTRHVCLPPQPGDRNTQSSP